jgi:phosphatidylethanolamine-binding protein (PEBP) family uncharacterized protein
MRDRPLRSFGKNRSMSVSTIATGARSTVESLTPVPAGAAQLTIASPVFFDRCLLPVQYTCQGAGISPSLDIGGLPAETQSLVVVVDDLDASNGHFIHSYLWLRKYYRIV